MILEGKNKQEYIDRSWVYNSKYEEIGQMSPTYSIVDCK